MDREARRSRPERTPPRAAPASCGPARSAPRRSDDMLTWRARTIPGFPCRPAISLISMMLCTVVSIANGSARRDHVLMNAGRDHEPAQQIPVSRPRSAANSVFRDVARQLAKIGAQRTCAETCSTRSSTPGSACASSAVRACAVRAGRCAPRARRPDRARRGASFRACARAGLHVIRQEAPVAVFELMGQFRDLVEQRPEPAVGRPGSCSTSATSCGSTCTPELAVLQQHRSSRPILADVLHQDGRDEAVSLPGRPVASVPVPPVGKKCARTPRRT